MTTFPRLRVKRLDTFRQPKQMKYPKPRSIMRAKKSMLLKSLRPITKRPKSTKKYKVHTKRLKYIIKNPNNPLKIIRKPRRISKSMTIQTPKNFKNTKNMMKKPKKIMFLSKPRNITKRLKRRINMRNCRDIMKRIKFIMRRVKILVKIKVRRKNFLVKKKNIMEFKKKRTMMNIRKEAQSRLHMNTQ